jgi:hypothetical protein
MHTHVQQTQANIYTGRRHIDMHIGTDTQRNTQVTEIHTHLYTKHTIKRNSGISCVPFGLPFHHTVPKWQPQKSGHTAQRALCLYRTSWAYVRPCDSQKNVLAAGKSTKATMQKKAPGEVYGISLSCYLQPAYIKKSS